MGQLTGYYLVAVVASGEHVRGVEDGLPQLFVDLRELLEVGRQLIVVLKFEGVVREFFDRVVVMVIVRVAVHVGILVIPVSG